VNIARNQVCRFISQYDIVSNLNIRCSWSKPVLSARNVKHGLLTFFILNNRFLEIRHDTFSQTVVFKHPDSNFCFMFCSCPLKTNKKCHIICLTLSLCDIFSIHFRNYHTNYMKITFLLISDFFYNVSAHIDYIRLWPEPEFPAGTGPGTRIPVLMRRNRNLLL
jgi:hypothetical protein